MDSHVVCGSPSAGDSASFYSKRKAFYQPTTTEQQEVKSLILRPESAIVSSPNDNLYTELLSFPLKRRTSIALCFSIKCYVIKNIRGLTELSFSLQTM